MTSRKNILSVHEVVRRNRANKRIQAFVHQNRVAMKIERKVNTKKPEYGNTVMFWLWDIVGKVCTRKEFLAWLEQNKKRAWLEGSSNPVMRNVFRGRMRDLILLDGRYYSRLYCQCHEGSKFWKAPKHA